MNLLILSRYDRLGASSRLRTMQYLPWLKAAGINAQILPFFDNSYLEDLYAGKRAGFSACKYHVARAIQLSRIPRPDAIWMEKEAFPWLPAWIEGWLMPKGIPMVTDHDDAIFHRYDQNGNGIVRTLLGNKIDTIMAGSALVLAGNPYLAQRADTAGAKRVEIVPTVVDARRYAASLSRPNDRQIRIGWVGTPGTWRQYMQPMMPMLAAVAQENNAKLCAVGAGVEQTGELEVLPWSEAEEGRLIQRMDIGLMPLDDSPWSRGKCGYKIIQYMACGLPVVASPTGVNTEIVEDGVTGFLATTEIEWREAITRLVADQDLRHHMGTAGRKRMEAHYSLQIWGPRVADLLNSVVL